MRTLIITNIIIQPIACFCAAVMAYQEGNLGWAVLSIFHFCMALDSISNYQEETWKECYRQEPINQIKK